VCRIVLNVHRIDQRGQHVHIEQEDRYGNSSRSSFTISGVTGIAPGRTLSKGTPLRVFRPAAGGRSACRLSAQITSPMVLFCRAAKPLAAACTSSSIVSVVRITSSYGLAPHIKHHTSLPCFV
jgi:hypothetical protein